MPAAAAIIPAAIGGISSVVGGVLGSGAAKKASQIQYQAAQQAAAEARALGQQYIPGIGAAGTAAAQGVTDAATAAALGVTGAAGQARSDVLDAARLAQAGVTGAAGQANEFLAPYLGAGGEAATTLRALMAPGGDLTKTFTAADMQAYDPGYQFRIDQAMKALQGSAAAKGGALGGGALRSLTGLSQNIASSEFGNAFNRFTQQQTDRFNRLNALTQLGAQVSGQAGANLTNAAQLAGGYGMTAGQLAGNYGMTGAQQAGQFGFTGAGQAGQFQTNAAQTQANYAAQIQEMINNLLTGGAQAQASGVVGSANAWQGALGGLANAATTGGNLYQQGQILNALRPARVAPSLATLMSLPLNNPLPSVFMTTPTFP